MKNIINLAQGLMIFSQYVSRKDESQYVYSVADMVNVYVGVNGEDTAMLELLGQKYDENLSSWDFKLD